MKYFTKNIENSKNATLTAYLHEPYEQFLNRKMRPAVLVISGGGYNFVSERACEPVARHFFAKGFHAFVLRYSVKEDARNMQPLIEAAEAMCIIRKTAEEWNIISDKIAVCGFSAGGHLAGSLGVFYNKSELLEILETTEKEIKPNAMILSYPVITSGQYAHRGSFKNLTGFDYDEEHSREYSLENFVDNKTPPTFVWHAVDDIAVPVENSLLFVNELQKHKVPYEAHFFNKGGHGIGMCNSETNNVNPHCAHWFELCIEWISDLFSFDV